MPQRSVFYLHLWWYSHCQLPSGRSGFHLRVCIFRLILVKLSGCPLESRGLNSKICTREFHWELLNKGGLGIVRIWIAMQLPETSVSHLARSSEAVMPFHNFSVSSKGCRPPRPSIHLIQSPQMRDILIKWTGFCFWCCCCCCWGQFLERDSSMNYWKFVPHSWKHIL